MPQPKLTDKLSWGEITEKIMTECNNRKPKFQKWLMSKEQLGGYFFNSLLYGRAYNIQESILHDDRDHFICVAGKEGTGKSTLAIQLASVIDPNFRLDKICFRPIDFIKGIRYSQPGDCFVLDEGNLFLFSRESMSDENRFMVKLFALMRQRNLCVIICVPNFFTLDSYVRDHRVDSLIYLQRKAHLYVYVKKAIQIISKEGAKYKQIRGIRVPHGTYFPGYFNRELPKLNDITVETYQKYKAQHFDQFIEDLEEAVQSKQGDPELISLKEASQLTGTHRKTLRAAITRGELPARRIGTKLLLDRRAVLSVSRGLAARPESVFKEVPTT